MMRRTDNLMAQRIDVAIVFRDMLGAEEATNYMIENHVPRHVIERVLAGLAVTRIGGTDMVEYAASDSVVLTPPAQRPECANAQPGAPVDG